MKTKFTPAPWVVKLEVEDEAIEIAMSSYLETPNSYYSCHKVLIEADDEEAIANARLITAAPEMYEEIERELSAILFEIDNCDNETKISILRVIAKRKQSLLAKARGE